MSRGPLLAAAASSMSTATLRADFAERAARTRVSSIVATRPERVDAIPEDAPISHAIAVMAFQKIHEVSLVAADGKVVGVITANDALRWTAAQLGYVEEER